MKGLNLDQILSQVWLEDYDNSKWVTVYNVQKMKSRNAVKFVTLTREPHQGIRKHKLVVYSADKKYMGPLHLCNAIKISCNCGRWCFYFEVAMANKGAADIIYSNGMLPNDNNPRQKIGICKHVIKALQYIKKYKL